MKTAKFYRDAYPNKTDDQIIESLSQELTSKVEEIHKLLNELNDKKYTKRDMLSSFMAGVDCEATNSTSFEIFLNSLND